MMTEFEEDRVEAVEFSRIDPFQPFIHKYGSDGVLVKMPEKHYINVALTLDNMHKKLMDPEDKCIPVSLTEVKYTKEKVLKS